MRRVAAAALTALCLTACGSTVQVTSTGSVPDSLTGDGSGTGAAAAPGGGPVAGTGVAGGGSGPAGTSGGLSGTGTATAGGTRPSGTSSSGVVSPGDRTPIEVGFMVTKDAGQAFKSLGYGGLSTGDGAKQAQAVTAVLNAHGGLAGHPIRPVVFEVDATGDAGQFQTACSQFFDDHKVRAILEITFNDVVNGCAKKHGVPLVAAGGITTDERTLAASPQLALPNQMSVEQAARQLVDGLVRQGWFRPTSATETVKIGLLTHDDPQYAGVQAIVSARLKAAGLSLADTGYQPYPHGSGDTATASNAGRSNVLRFQSRGINRVVVLDAGGFGMSWFGISAASQSYYPRYGLTTLSEPSLEPAVLTPQQLAGSAGIGWAPVLDTSVPYQSAMSARTTVCLAAMKRAGEDTSLPAERVAAESLCEAGFTLQDAWRAGQPDLPSFQRGLPAIGSGYQPVSVFGADFRRSRAAVDRYRAISYDAGCDCYRYAGAVTRVR